MTGKTLPKSSGLSKSELIDLFDMAKRAAEVKAIVGMTSDRAEAGDVDTEILDALSLVHREASSIAADLMRFSDTQTFAKITPIRG